MTPENGEFGPEKFSTHDVLLAYMTDSRPEKCLCLFSTHDVLLAYMTELVGIRSVLPVFDP